jgi:peroxiredoxin/protocatechuate 3,4-dioxygenase beta subunit
MRMKCFGILLIAMATTTNAVELEITVVDFESGDPINQTAVRGNIDGSLFDVVTGDNGVCVFPLPEGGVEYNVTLTVDAAGYVPALVHWEVADHQLPDTYTVRLERGTEISGRVAYDDGTPIEDALVRLYVGQTREGIVQPAITDLEIKTDADGRWQCDRVPKSLGKLQVRVTPPGEPRVRSVTFSEGGEHSIAALRDGSATIEIARRFTLAGVVRNQAGEPIAGARLMAWPTEQTAASASTVESDRDGAFAFQNVRAERMMISTVKDGLSPDMTAATPGPDAEPIEITLKPGHTIKGRVTNFEGGPLEGALVAPHTWRGQRVLAIEMETDADGQFEWTGAPEEGAVFEFRKSGYASLLEEPLIPDPDEYLIQMRELLRVGGAVVDDETGEPLEGFKVFQGTVWDTSNEVQWAAYHSDEGYKGEYEIYIRAGTPAVQVRIEADGYLPVFSRVFTEDEGYQRFDARMKKGTGPEGVIFGPDGEPLPRVAVYMTPLSDYLILKNSNTQDNVTRYQITDEDGRFTFAPVHPEFRLAVIDSAGSAVQSFTLGEESYDLTLEPPAVVEGVAYYDGELAPYERVQLSYDPELNNGVALTFNTNTDPDGRYRFESIPAGEAKVALLKRANNQFAETNAELVVMQAGENAAVNLGEGGRAVIGKVVVGDTDLAGRPIGLQPIWIETVAPLPVPNEVDRNDHDAFDRWYADWKHTDAGRRYRAASRKYVAEIAPNGEFRAADLLPAEYLIRWQLALDYDGDVANIVHGFTLDAGEGDFYLGEIAASVPKDLAIGDEAPLFEVKSLTGAPVKLTDFRGNYVLLDFWATWCGPCIGETPYLVETFERFGDRDDFAMIGLSLDDDTDAPLTYTTENNMDWTQAFLGSGGGAVATDYGVQGIPSIMLIDPEGRIIETGLRGAGIVDAVAKHLE